MLDDENGLFLALVNDEGQYSIWPAATPAPHGWQVAREAGDKASCLAFIEAQWTDMRPKSLRAVQA